MDRLKLLFLVLICGYPPAANADRFYCSRLYELAAKAAPNDSQLNLEKRNEWVNAHHGRDREVAGLVAPHIKVVSRDEFRGALDRSIQELRNKNIPPEDVVFVYYGKGSRLTNPHKSGQFVTGYILGHYPEFSKSEVWEESMLKTAPKFDRPKHFVIIDDASYSGTQLKASAGFMGNRKATRNDVASVSCLVPFLSSKAKSETDKRAAEAGITLDWLAPNSMPTIREILQSSGRSDFESDVTRLWGSLALDSPITVFYHKIPDSMSFPPRLRNATVPGVPEDGPSYRFLTGGTPQYHRVTPAEVTGPVSLPEPFPVPLLPSAVEY